MIEATALAPLATKKELVVNLATKDPFMRIAEIAAIAGTTQRYVRTILCEARLSLTQMRRNYARTMERRLHIDVQMPHAAAGLAETLAQQGSEVGVHHPHLTKVVDAELAQLLERPADEPLLCLSRTRCVEGQPFFLSRVVTPDHLILREELLAADKPLRQILGLEVHGQTEFVDRSLEVIRADKFCAACLGLPEGAPLLKSGNVIVTNGRRVGVEFNYFDAFRVRFVFSGLSEYALRIQEKPAHSGEIGRRMSDLDMR